MEYLFVKQSLDLPEQNRPELKWTDQMKLFVSEMAQHHLLESGKVFDMSKVDLQNLPEPIFSLRRKPRPLDYAETCELIMKYGFFCSDRYVWSNQTGKGIPLSLQRLKNGQIMYEGITGLYWQQAGSSGGLNYDNAQKYIKRLNTEKFGGLSNWRLPTLEEAMSLMRPRKSHGLHIEPIFDTTQSWIWTADRVGASAAWAVCFHNGYCALTSTMNDVFVRAVC